jgi:carboxypeptidase Q
MQMLSRVAAICTVLATALALASAQRRPDLAQVLSTISASVTSGASTELLRQLTDDIGARLVGSPGYERAAQWAVARFKEAGATNVRFEQFTLPNAWQRGPAHARIVSPAARPLRIGSVGWGPSTPAGGVRGDVILVSDLSPAALRSQSTRLKNRIVLVDLEKARYSGQEGRSSP